MNFVSSEAPRIITEKKFILSEFLIHFKQLKVSQYHYNLIYFLIKLRNLPKALKICPKLNFPKFTHKIPTSFCFDLRYPSHIYIAHLSRAFQNISESSFDPLFNWLRLHFSFEVVPSFFRANFTCTYRSRSLFCYNLKISGSGLFLCAVGKQYGNWSFRLYACAHMWVCVYVWAVCVCMGIVCEQQANVWWIERAPREIIRMGIGF